MAQENSGVIDGTPSVEAVVTVPTFTAGDGNQVQESFVSASSATADAGSAEADAPPLWTGEVEAGVVNTTGNSHSDSLRGRLRLQYEPGFWKYGFTTDYTRVSESGQTTAEQFNSSIKSDRTLTKRSYLFAAARYEIDRFAGYRPRVAESAGYGRRFPFSDRVRLEAETGVGGRHTWAVDGTRKSEAILRLAGTFRWTFGMQSEFSEEVFSEFGDTNVHSESQTSLKTRMDAFLALKLNVAVKHNTVVEPARHKTDTITSMTLVYDL